MGMITEIRPEPRDNFIDGIKPRGYVHWIAINTISVYVNANITMPSNTLVVRGW